MRLKSSKCSILRIFSPQSLMFSLNTQSNEKALLRGLHYSRWDLLSPPRHSGRVFGPESRQLELGHAASLDSGQKRAGMTARGLCKSPSRDLFSQRLFMSLRDTREQLKRPHNIGWVERSETQPNFSKQRRRGRRENNNLEQEKCVNREPLTHMRQTVSQPCSGRRLAKLHTHVIEGIFHG
jgi:hypothetical protein